MTTVAGLFDKTEGTSSISSFFGNDDGRVVLITSFLSLFSILLFSIVPVGYHMVILNVPQSVILDSFSYSFSTLGFHPSQGALSIIWSVTVSCQALGALIGCTLVASIESKYGTKKGIMVVSNCFLLVGSSLSFLAAYIPFAPFLMLGRVLTGVHTGLVCALVPIFVQQIAPKKIKGSIGCLIHVSACFGSAIGAILSLDFMLGGENTWGLLFLLSAILALIGIGLSALIPDTPNHLLQCGSYSEAIESILFFYGVTRTFDDEEDVVQRYSDIVTELPPQAPFSKVIRRPDTLRGILLGCCVSATQIFSGSMASISYSSSMFEAVSFLDVLVPFLPALGSLVSIVLTIPAFQLVESRGRRPVLLSTLVVCVIADCLLFIFSLLSQDDMWASWAFGLAFLLYGIGYNMGTGPISYFLPAELVPADSVSSGLGAAVAVNYLSTLVTTLTFYPLNVAFGGYSYLMFIIPTSVSTLLLWFFLPETKFHYVEDSVHVQLLQELGPVYGAL